MSISDRAQITNYDLTQSMGSHVIVGNCFAFVKSEFFKNSAFSWLQSLVGHKTSNKINIVHLFKREGVDIAGLKLEQVKLGKFELCSITSDKSLYKADNDTIDLLLLNPAQANQTSKITVLCNNAPYSFRHVRLGANGEGKLSLQDLPGGEYEVLFDGIQDQSRYCKFTVAQYKLVPLVAELKGRQMGANSQLTMIIALSTFGTPVDGPITISLFDRGTLLSTSQATAEKGFISFAVQLSGAGPHSLNFQVVDDPSKTASLPIVGSRATERSLTLFNPLGAEIFASLLPTEGSTEVRGLYLTEGGLSSSPIRLEYDENLFPRLETTAEITSLTVVRIDPSFPEPRPDAINTATHQHPSHYDQDYNGAIRLFERGLFEDSLRLFDEARSRQSNPHPFYAYFAACCHAKLKRIDQAIEQLRLSIVDGWNDFTHMQEDADLETLQGDPRFESLKTGGLAEFTFENLPANQVLEIPSMKALTILSLGAVVNNQPWEGWTSYLMPSQISASLDCKKECKSGETSSLKIKVNSANASTYSAYLIVKDARLLSQDKPEARLAAAVKEYVEIASKNLRLEFPTKTVANLACEKKPQVRMRHLSSRSDGWGDPADSWGGPPGSAGSWGSMDAILTGSASAFESTGAWGGSSGAMQPPATADAFEEAETGSLSADFAFFKAGQQAQPSPAPAASLAAPLKLRNLMGGSSSAQGASMSSASASQSGLLLHEPASTAVTQKGHEPEVLFADFIELKDSEAILELPLPLAEADYLVECFIICDWDWHSCETRFRAISDPLAEFTLPRFVSAGEAASSFLHLGSRSQEFKCELTLNGKAVELHRDGKIFSSADSIKEPLVSLRFSAGPGVYKAVLKDLQGKTLSQIEQTVDEPGKLRRRQRTMRMLKDGDLLALADDPSIVALRILPGLKESFNVLLEATADYSHCCCEQTAAKIMSGCAMYMFAGADRKLKEKAEAIIIAGIKREEKMWLRSRGFKAYPEWSDQPDEYYSKAAAQHLSNLALLDNEVGSMSKDLRTAIQLGVQMSSDVLAAYKIDFPPKQIQSMKDAYTACRFSNNGIKEDALKYVRSKTANVDTFLKSVDYNPHWGYAVNTRIEAAYAAAALMRQKQGVDLGRSLALANHVIKSFNEQGRLYSTIDSVAAISLFAEMLEAKLVGGAGAAKVEINGILQQIEEASRSTECIESVRCIEGIVAVEIETEVLESWAEFDGKLPLRVALEKNGQAQRAFKLGDQLNIRVKLEQGYKDGDLLWLCLPDSLSRVYGGGQVKLFSLDFAGQSELLIPIAVTGTSEGADGKKGQQKLALCVRNMYEEERGGNPGLIPISISS